MLWLKALHVVAMVTWFAGLFYLPRLFVYHADAADAPSIVRFRVMEHRLFVLMSIGALATALFGIAMIVAAPGYLEMGWLRVKLGLILALVAYHLLCYKYLRAFALGRPTPTARWFRAFNEVPSLLLLGIVILAIVKPF